MCFGNGVVLPAILPFDFAWQFQIRLGVLNFGWQFGLPIQLLPVLGQFSEGYNSQLPEVANTMLSSPLLGYPDPCFPRSMGYPVPTYPMGYLMYSHPLWATLSMSPPPMAMGYPMSLGYSMWSLHLPLAMLSCSFLRAMVFS